MMSGFPAHGASDLHLDVIGLDEAGTLPGLFQLRVARTPDTIAYRQYDAGDGVWKAYTWKQMAGLVARWQAALDKVRASCRRPGRRPAPQQCGVGVFRPGRACAGAVGGTAVYHRYT